MAPVGGRTLHTVFTSECNNVQFDWFATGVFESFRASGAQLRSSESAWLK